MAPRDAQNVVAAKHAYTRNKWCLTGASLSKKENLLEKKNEKLEINSKSIVLSVSYNLSKILHQYLDIY